MTTNTKSINAVAALCHDQSRRSGFWDDQTADEDGKHVLAPELVHKVIPEKLMLITTEVAEAMEDYRKNDMETTRRLDNCKPIGFPTELADIVIRVFDLAGSLGIDIEAEIEKKMQYNATRPYKHGKTC